MSSAGRKELHELVDALPPFADLSEAERATLQASLRQAEEEIAAGKATPAEDLVRELRGTG